MAMSPDDALVGIDVLFKTRRCMPWKAVLTVCAFFVAPFRFDFSRASSILFDGGTTSDDASLAWHQAAADEGPEELAAGLGAPDIPAPPDPVVAAQRPADVLADALRALRGAAADQPSLLEEAWRAVDAMKAPQDAQCALVLNHVLPAWKEGAWSLLRAMAEGPARLKAWGPRVYKELTPGLPGEALPQDVARHLQALLTSAEVARAREACRTMATWFPTSTKSILYLAHPEVADAEPGVHLGCMPPRPLSLLAPEARCLVVTFEEREKSNLRPVRLGAYADLLARLDALAVDCNLSGDTLNILQQLGDRCPNLSNITVGWSTRFEFCGTPEEMRSLLQTVSDAASWGALLVCVMENAAEEFETENDEEAAELLRLAMPRATGLRTLKLDGGSAIDCLPYLGISSWLRALRLAMPAQAFGGASGLGQLLAGLTGLTSLRLAVGKRDEENKDVTVVNASVVLGQLGLLRMLQKLTLRGLSWEGIVELPASLRSLKLVKTGGSAPLLPAGTPALTALTRLQCSCVPLSLHLLSGMLGGLAGLTTLRKLHLGSAGPHHTQLPPFHMEIAPHDVPDLLGQLWQLGDLQHLQLWGLSLCGLRLPPSLQSLELFKTAGRVLDDCSQLVFLSRLVVSTAHGGSISITPETWRLPSLRVLRVE